MSEAIPHFTGLSTLRGTYQLVLSSPFALIYVFLPQPPLSVNELESRLAEVSKSIASMRDELAKNMAAIQTEFAKIKGYINSARAKEEQRVVADMRFDVIIDSRVSLLEKALGIQSDQPAGSFTNT